MQAVVRGAQVRFELDAGDGSGRDGDLRPPPSAGALAKLARWNEEAGGFMRGKLAPLVADGRLDPETAELLPDVLSAFLDGICVRAVLEVDGAVPALGRNIEAFLCRIVPGG